MNWAARALDLIARGERAAMVTIVQVSGSAPRDAGARMIVSRETTFDTIGGGNLELHLVDQARRLMASDSMGILQQDYPLGPLMAQCCGGRVRVLVERLDASSRTWLTAADEAERGGTRYTLEGVIAGGAIARLVATRWPSGVSEGAEIFTSSGALAGRQETWSRVVERIAPVATELYLFGAGHVGRAIAHVAETLPFRFRWYDSRPDAAHQAGAALAENLRSIAIEAKAGAFFLVVTHSHELDYSLVQAILGRGDAAFCGLIGSATKRARFVSRLARDGIEASKLTCPIGAGMIHSKAPAAIAVGVAAELFVRQEARSSQEAQRSIAPNPPPPGVSIVNTSPGLTSTLAVDPSSTVSPLARRR